MGTSEWTNKAWTDLTQKVFKTSETIGADFPHASVEGIYKREKAHWWTAGFWPGLLWLVYADSKDEDLKRIAEECEFKINQEVPHIERLDHDIGFMWILTSVARFKLTGNAEARDRAVLGANLLAARFNPIGNYIRAWNTWADREDNSGYAIIDSMMNIPLLFWAAEETGDPRFKHVAVKHGHTILENFIEKDGSVRHIVNFDPESGEKISAVAGQGYASDSAWSRGTAWAVYGLGLYYSYTGDPAFLEAAKKVAHFFIANLREDAVPSWDFRTPDHITPYTDSSAGAIAASGLLQLADLVPPDEEKLYFNKGVSILRSLYENYGSWQNEEEQGLILHGASHFPEQKYLDNPLIYGDYFFAEGIAKLRGSRLLFW